MEEDFVDKIISDIRYIIFSIFIHVFDSIILELSFRGVIESVDTNPSSSLIRLKNLNLIEFFFKCLKTHLKDS